MYFSRGYGWPFVNCVNTKPARPLLIEGGSRLYVSGPGITVTGGHPTEFQPYQVSHYGVEGVFVHRNP